LSKQKPPNSEINLLDSSGLTPRATTSLYERFSSYLADTKNDLFLSTFYHSYTTEKVMISPVLREKKKS
jgi:hypothetical protein